MNENITKLIRRGSLKDAFNLIQQLDKYFDLSKADQRKNYLILQKLKDNVSDKIWVAIKSKRPGYAKGDAQFYRIGQQRGPITIPPHKRILKNSLLRRSLIDLRHCKANNPNI